MHTSTKIVIIQALRAKLFEFLTHEKAQLFMPHNKWHKKIIGSYEWVGGSSLV